MADSTFPETDEQQRVQRPSSRRGFLKTAAGGAAAGTAFFAAGCDASGGGGRDDGSALPAPSFVFAAGGTDPLAITFNVTGSSGAEGASYEWQFGDGITETTDRREITHVYDASDSYEVTLTVTSRGGATASQMQVVNVGVAPDQVVTLDFSNDFGVLNYAYALEQLEGAFYARVVAALDSGRLSFDQQETADYFRDLTAHETIHRITLQTALGENAIPAITPNFSSVEFGNPDNVLATAQVLEDTGVSAYNGAASYLSDPTFLTIAGKIVSVEARHASAVRSTIDPLSENFSDLEDLTDFGTDPENALGAALPPEDVLAAAGGFFATEIEATNT